MTYIAEPLPGVTVRRYATARGKHVTRREANAKLRAAFAALRARPSSSLQPVRAVTKPPRRVTPRHQASKPSKPAVAQHVAHDRPTSTPRPAAAALVASGGRDHDGGGGGGDGRGGDDGGGDGDGNGGDSRPSQSAAPRLHGCEVRP